MSGLVFLNAPSGGTDTRVDHDPSDDQFWLAWERVAAEPWIPAANRDGSPSGDLIKLGPFPNDDTDATATDARGSTSPLGGCRSTDGSRAVAYTEDTIDVSIITHREPCAIWGGGPRLGERESLCHWRIAWGSGRIYHTPCSDIKSQVLGERVASRKPCAARDEAGWLARELEFFATTTRVGVQNRKPAVCLSPEKLPSCSTGESELSPGPGSLASCQVEGGNGANEAGWGTISASVRRRPLASGAISAGEREVLQGKASRELTFFCVVFWGRRQVFQETPRMGKV